MRIDRILRLADRVEGLPYATREELRGRDSHVVFGSHLDEPTAFNMASWSCGTSACIAGHAAWMAKCDQDYDFGLSYQKNLGKIDGIARDYLRLSGLDAFTLFIPEREVIDGVTPQRAAAKLRHFAATGEISWEADPYTEEYVYDCE